MKTSKTEKSVPSDDVADWKALDQIVYEEDNTWEGAKRLVDDGAELELLDPRDRI